MHAYIRNGEDVIAIKLLKEARAKKKNTTRIAISKDAANRSYVAKLCPGSILAITSAVN